MPDIWNQIETSLQSDLGGTIFRLREDPVIKTMGSEIERALAVYLVVMFRFGGVPFRLERPTSASDDAKGFFLAPQQQIGTYRVDFLFGFAGKPDLRDCVVVECDGHDWHERTKEQAARDKKRDRFLSTKAGRVIHFTGSEIYRDSSSCWQDAIQALAAIHNFDSGDIVG